MFLLLVANHTHHTYTHIHMHTHTHTHTQCSQDCGGYRTRLVVCIVPQTLKIVSNERCATSPLSGPRPPTTEFCENKCKFAEPSKPYSNVSSPLTSLFRLCGGHVPRVLSAVRQRYKPLPTGPLQADMLLCLWPHYQAIAAGGLGGHLLETI